MTLSELEKMIAIGFGVRLSKEQAQSVGAELDRIRSHVYRLEESLRVALEARAEAVEVLGAVMARVDALVFHRDDAGVVTVQDCPLEVFTDMVEDFDRARLILARAIGKGE